tara:strand:- start:25 stop:336 length:312 start_codon:yes stop_codon:yes gene_type:complete
MNYTAEQTQYMVEQYTNKPTRVTVDRLAKELNKSSKSIIGKLSRENVYQRNVYKTKAGEMPVTKVEIVHEIAELLNLSEEALAGLEKAPKAALKALQTAAGSL